MDKTNHQNENKIISPDQQLEDINSDKSLRPSSFSDFIGQEKIIDNLNQVLSHFEKCVRR